MPAVTSLSSPPVSAEISPKFVMLLSWPDMAIKPLFFAFF